MFFSDQTCNPSDSLISSSSNLAPGLGNGRTVLAAILMFVMVVYSWYVKYTTSCLKDGTHKGFCFWVLLHGHALGAKLLHVYQLFHERNSFSGAEFPQGKLLQNIKPIKYLGVRSQGKLNKLQVSFVCSLMCTIIWSRPCFGAIKALFTLTSSATLIYGNSKIREMNLYQNGIMAAFSYCNINLSLLCK